MKRLILIDEKERPSTYYLLKAVERRLEESLNLEDPYDPECADDPYLDMYEEDQKLELLSTIKRFVDDS